jgi:hypothetical protein
MTRQWVSQRDFGLAAMCWFAVTSLAACSGGETALPSLQTAGLAAGSVTGYTAANALFTNGYSDRELGQDHYAVRASGSAVTPAERLEKIALARAAQIGVETGRAFFKSGCKLYLQARQGPGP